MARTATVRADQAVLRTDRRDPPPMLRTDRREAARQTAALLRPVRVAVQGGGLTVTRRGDELTARLHDDFEAHGLRLCTARDELYVRTVYGLALVACTGVVYGRAMEYMRAQRAVHAERARERTRSARVQAVRKRKWEGDRSEFFYQANGHQWRCRAGRCVCPDIVGPEITGTGGGQLGTVQRSDADMALRKPRPWDARRVQLFYGR